MAKTLPALEAFGVLVANKLNSFHTHDQYYEEFRDELLREMRKFVADDKARREVQKKWKAASKAKQALIAANRKDDDDVWL